MPKEWTIIGEMSAPKHQIDDAICFRHSLIRCLNFGLDNRSYDGDIKALQTSNGLTNPADVVWNMTQNYIEDNASETQAKEIIFKKPVPKPKVLPHGKPPLRELPKKGKGKRICKKCGGYK
jgi:hypothetical protein